MKVASPVSERLTYRRYGIADVGTFHALATDEHVKRYLLDGETMERVWAAIEVEGSDALFDRLGVGLWLAYEGERPVGFAGFRIFEEVGPAPQLLYAFLPDVCGRGFATEAGGAMLEAARAAGLREILSAVDNPNAASIRVLEKLGFKRDGEKPGAFGPMYLFRLEL